MQRRLRIIIGPLIVAIIAIGYGTYRHAHQPAAAPVATGSQGGMVALGDSVAAGIGLTPYSDASACDRTDQAYPKLVASTRDLKLTSLACSGASLTMGVRGAQTVNSLALPSQLDRLFAAPKPQLITLTIGANDLGWTQLIGECITATCATATDDAIVSARLADLKTNLGTTLEQIHSHYGTDTPRVVLTGYYDLYTPSASTCSDTSGIDSTESAWINTQLMSLNSIISTTSADFAFARYALVSFSGHELCSSQPWIQGLVEMAPYHPTADGQAAIARAVDTAAKS